jgi:hypothetical protein
MATTCLIWLFFPAITHSLKKVTDNEKRRFVNTAGAAFFACSFQLEIPFEAAKNEALEYSL